MDTTLADVCEVMTHEIVICLTVYSRVLMLQWLGETCFPLITSISPRPPRANHSPPAAPVPPVAAAVPRPYRGAPERSVAQAARAGRVAAGCCQPRRAPRRGRQFATAHPTPPPPPWAGRARRPRHGWPPGAGPARTAESAGRGCREYVRRSSLP